MKKMLSAILAIAMIFTVLLSSCVVSDGEKYEGFRDELLAALSAELEGATSAETMIIWEAQAKIRGTEYDPDLSLEENEKAIQDIADAALEELFWQRATIDDYVKDGKFKEDYAVALLTDAEGGGFTSSVQLVFDWLVSDAEIKARLAEVKYVNEIFESSAVVFLSDGSAYLENHYASLMVEAKMTFSTAEESTLKTEIVRGRYEISSEPDADGLYAITLIAEGGTVLAFRFNTHGGSMRGEQIFNDEIYERTENINMQKRSISDYLTAEGYFKKNSVEAAKTDYRAELGTAVEGVSGVETLADAYREAVVSFTESGKAVITDRYTELGASIFGISEKITVGTYTVDKTPSGENGYYKISVVSEDGSTVFFIDADSGTLYRTTALGDEPFSSFTTEELLANSGAGYRTEDWSDADGTILTDIVYGNEERNLMDIYVPAGYDPNGENGVILFVHGGSWVSGGKEDMANLCKKYAKMGYFTASINHSYAMSALSDGSQATLLTINEEVGRAFAKLAELSDENGWSITQAALSGYSSGCHVAYLYAYSDGNEADAPIPVKAVFGMVGCMDFREEYWKNVATDGPGVAALGLNDARLADRENPYDKETYDRLIDQISPLAFAKRGDAVPSVVAYAMLDETLIDWYNGTALGEALDSFGIANEVFMLPNSGHVCGNNPSIVSDYNDAMLEYLKTYFGY